MTPDATASPAAAPDWNQIQREVLCPLCDYNLRGLIEPRCPECGHGFLWSELLRQSNLHPPWLFEYRKSRKFTSIVLTFFWSQTPGRFWLAVRPTQEPVVRRLILYSLCVASLAFVMIVADRSAIAGKYYYSIIQSRREGKAYAELSMRRPSYRAMVLKEYGSVDAMIDRRYPIASLLDVVRLMARNSEQVGIVFLLAAIAWPWLTLGSLLIFLRSMRKSQVKIAHVLRCAIYSTDVISLLMLVPAGFLIIPPLVTATLRNLYVGSWNWNVFLAGWLCVPLLLGMIVAWKLAAAYRQYLGFPHAVAVAVASQLIVVLFILAVAPVTWLM